MRYILKNKLDEYCSKEFMNKGLWTYFYVTDDLIEYLKSKDFDIIESEFDESSTDPMDLPCYDVINICDYSYSYINKFHWDLLKPHQMFYCIDKLL